MQKKRIRKPPPPEKRKEYRDRYNKKPESKQKTREYLERNRERNNKKRNETRNRKMKEDPLFRLQKLFKDKLRKYFKRINSKKTNKTINILGCTIDEFKIHLESKFESWMTWENKGLYNGTLNYDWDIDHIIPLDTAICEEDIIRLNHFTNLRPLCSYTNRHIKRNKLL